MKIKIVKRSGVQIRPFGLLDYGDVVECKDALGKLLITRPEFEEVAEVDEKVKETSASKKAPKTIKDKEDK